LDRADKTLFEMAHHANVAGLRAGFWRNPQRLLKNPTGLFRQNARSG
jgi:hypothetical protein